MQKPQLSKPSEIKLAPKVLVFGPSGSGKTRFAATAPRPLIYDIEGGTMSLLGNTKVEIIKKDELLGTKKGELPKRLLQFVEWGVQSPDHDTLVIDSLTELQAAFLDAEKPKYTDPRQAYGAWGDYLRALLQFLQNSNKNVIYVARAKLGESLDGKQIMPEMSPGAFATVPPLVDYVLYLQKALDVDSKEPVMVPTLYTETTALSNAWTKVRVPLPNPIKNPRFKTITNAIKEGLSKNESGVIQLTEQVA